MFDFTQTCDAEAKNIALSDEKIKNHIIQVYLISGVSRCLNSVIRGVGVRHDIFPFHVSVTSTVSPVRGKVNINVFLWYAVREIVQHFQPYMSDESSRQEKMI